MTFGYTVGSRKESGREDWKVYYDNSILADGEEMRQLIDCAKRLGVYLSFGYSEREENTATLYNSNMLISPEGPGAQSPQAETNRRRAARLGRCAAGFLPRDGHALGKNREPHLLGELHAARARRALREGHYDLHFTEHK